MFFQVMCLFYVCLPSGASQLSDCVGCTPGSYCDSPGSTNVTAECFEGFYCSGNASSPQPTDGTTGDVCPEAHFCPVGSSFPLPCSNGTFSNHTGAALCYDCPEGFYCPPASSTPTACPQGYYCPAGTGLDWQACPAGTFGSRQGLTTEEHCTICPGGFYCEVPGSSNVTGSCDPGYFCVSGVTTIKPTGGVHHGNGSICTAGHYCPGNTVLPMPCEAGTHNPLTQQSACSVCPTGYYCPPATIEYSIFPCPTGHYCPNGTNFARQYPCPAGTYNPYNSSESTEDCISCSPGHYCESAGNISPTGNCSEGYYCVSGSHTGTPNPYDGVLIGNSSIACEDAGVIGGRCYPGTFCPSGAEFPLLCPPGMFCDSFSLTLPTGPCDAGYFCVLGETTAKPVNQTCPTGHYCPLGSDSPMPCPVGTFLNSTRSIEESDCLACSESFACNSLGLSFPHELCNAGFYCPTGQNTSSPEDFICPLGHFCPAGSPRPISCPSGMFQDVVGQSDCKVCPAGYYCDALFAFFGRSSYGVVSPVECPAGYFCVNGTEYAMQFPCPNGTFSNETGLSSEVECVSCTGGRVCSGIGLTEPDGICSAGYFCAIGAYTSTPTDGLTGDVCFEGHYCEAGSSISTPCPSGTFSNQTNLQNESQCLPCTPGHYCPIPGLTSPVGFCSAGHFCTLGAVNPNPSLESYGSHCPAGHYCTAGSTAPQACPIGYYNPTTSSTNISACIDCTPGHFCEQTGLSMESGPCQSGYFCSGAATVSTPNDGVTGDICPPGHHCPDASSEPLPCREGTYVNFTGAAECLECPSGFFCLVETVHPQLCPPGFFCPNGSGIDYISCPRGTFNPHFGLSSEEQCTPCTGGHFCGFENATEVSGACSAGYFCEGGVDTPTPTGAHRGSGGICPIAHFCPQQASVPNSCETGTYQDLTGQSACFDCPAGYFCPANSSAFLNTPCPPGYYCPSGTQHDTQFPCPAGSYNPSNGSSDYQDCIPCPPTMFCETEGLSSPSGLCDEGYYCVFGSISSTPLPITNTSLLQNYSTTCPVLADALMGDVCPIGTFCPLGSDLPIPCPPGQFCGFEGLSVPSGNCTAGHYCPQGSTLENQQLCSSGHFCPEGATVEIPCPSGTFSNASGNAEVDDCLLCTAGFYCNGRGLTAPTGECSSGYYCPEGQTDATPLEFVCTPGHFCEAGSPILYECLPGTFQAMRAQSSCDECPSGYYCDPFESIFNNGSSSNDSLLASEGISTPVICPPGYYCLAGTRLANELPCPRGTFSNTSGLSSEAQCKDCVPGMFCEEPALTQPSGNCSAGYICSFGAISSTPSDNTTGMLCPEGRYCIEGSSSGALCPIGTFNSELGLTSAAECQPCLTGMYCASAGLRRPTGDCSAGYFCQLGSPEPNPVDEAYGYLCPSGSYCPRGAVDPLPCPEGSFRFLEGGQSADDCQFCLPGFYCPFSGSSVVFGECFEGFYCFGNASSPQPTDGTTGDVCPEAHFCPVGSSFPLPCSNGTFSNHTGAALCYDCPEGFYCPPASSTPTACPQGYYCPAGTGLDWQPCPAGTFGSRQGLTMEEECSQCTPGHYCDTTALREPSGVCNGGYFCTLGVNTPEPSDNHTGSGGLCPLGHFCPPNSSQPIGCSAGTFNPHTAQPSCFTCPAGFFCEANSIDFTNSSCPSGYYCPNGTEHATQFPCAPGSYNAFPGAESEASCLPCPPRLYCEGHGLSVPTGDCSAGYYCTIGSHTDTPLQTVNSSLIVECPTTQLASPGALCGPGTFCPIGSAIPVPCTPGMFCDVFGSAAPTGPCEAGYFCNGSSIEPTPSDSACPAGHFCLNGSTHPTPCSIGTFSSTPGNPDSSYCQPCTPGHYCSGAGLTAPEGECLGGFYCPQGQSDDSPLDFECPQGYFCPNGSALPLPCIRGRYQPSGGQLECLECPSGFFCDPLNVSQVDGNQTFPAPGVVVPEVCPSGHYCSLSTEYATQHPCAFGSYSNNTGLHSADECVPCPPSMYCANEGLSYPSGLCSSGFFCVLGASTPQPTDGMTGDVCPTGHYCPEGSEQGLPCPEGTFNNVNGIANSSQCAECLPGSYCSTPGLSLPTALCSAGVFCTGGAVVPTPANISEGVSVCPTGSYCVEGSSNPQPCPIGTFQPFEGAQNLSECIPCTPGLYCGFPGLENETADCDAGYFCVLRASVPNPTDNVTGNICPQGSFCPSGAPYPLECPDGTFSNQTGAELCSSCPAGQFCVFKSRSAPCPQGYYCPEGTALNWSPCPEGTYGTREGLSNETECKVCDGGSYCSGEALMAVSDNCSAGYYCQERVNISDPSLSNPHTGSGDACPIAHFCPTGSSQPLPCEAGTYSPSQGLSECLPCPRGQYCLAESSVGLPCVPGYFCPSGSQTYLENPCPPGSFNNHSGAVSIAECLACTSGQYCPSSGLEVPFGPCSEGFYCFSGSTTATPFDIGLNSSIVCQSSVESCLCSDSDDINGGTCPIGYYCPMGAPLPISCTPGMYCPYELLAEPFGVCNAGYFCNGSATSPEQFPCAPGHYCTKGSNNSTPCPLGTFSEDSLNQNISSCLSCPNGMFCNELGIATPSGACSEGYFCSENRLDFTSPTPHDFICPRGHFCPERSSTPLLCESGSYQPNEGQSDCLVCPPGLFCNQNNGVTAVTTPQECPQGYYCPSGTGFTFRPCPAGSYSNRTGLESEADCEMCPPGLYCEGIALTEPSGFCFPGYFCTGCSHSPTPNNFTISENENDTNGLIWTGNGECPNGFYCPQGSRVPIACPQGTFSQTRCVTNVTGCELCPSGRFCAFTGPVMVEQAPPCAPGFVCTGGSPTPTPDFGSHFGYPCPVGFYCEEGAVIELSCEPGTYNPDFAQSSCFNCTAGMMCAFSNMTAPIPCLPGYYCPEGTAIAAACAEGTFSTSTNLSSVEDCTFCDSGKYCMGTALTMPTGDCAPGYFCHFGAATPTPDYNPSFASNGPCPRGSFCPSGAIAPTGCPISTFRDTVGARNESDCHPCTPGKFCNTTNLDSPTGECSTGYYCPLGTAISQPSEFICPLGAFCPEGSATPMPCPAGFYQPITGQGSCEICPAGRFCLNGTSVPEICPPHSFCPAGTGREILSCPPGTFTPADLVGLREASECRPCRTGSYCRNGEVSGNCSAGYFCLSGNPSPNPNVTFEYPILSECRSNASSDTCEALTAYLSNFYDLAILIELEYNVAEYNGNLTNDCDPFSAHPILGGLCRPSHYCPEGTTEQIPCPEGTYNSEDGGAFLTDCLPCPAGFKCISGFPTPIACRPGHFCPADSVEIACPIGTFRNIDSGHTRADCFSCPAGFLCNDTGIVDFSTFPCPPGHYCLERSIVPTLCPPGTQRNESQGASIDDCLPCRGGYYCPPRNCQPDVDTLNSTYFGSNITEFEDFDFFNESVVVATMNDSDSACDFVNITCPALCSCDASRTIDSHIHGIPCRTGYYCPQGSTAELTCPGGFTCSVTTSEPVPCRAGYYCPPGSEFESRCEYPFYCPFSSADPEFCAGGSVAINVSLSDDQLRTSQNDSCLTCDEGLFTNDGITCFECPEGYYCPRGTADPLAFPCTPGFYCPPGSTRPVACPRGRYNPRMRAANTSDCLPCPPGLYNSRLGKPWRLILQYVYW